MSLNAGDKLGPYEIVELIGKGGMGEVYRAHDPRLGRDVAIKVSAEQFSERFEREARAVASLNHPNICALYDVGPNYLVMELVEGTPLKGPMRLADALALGTQIADALDAAHRKGITHRDLKPANILVNKSGVKLLDFGLAKMQRPVSHSGETLTETLTGPGTIVGTLNYMSPEQLQGKDADTRSDIFSFGLVLYEMITGKRAFDGSNPASVIAAILERPAPALEPEALNRVVSACLAKDPDDRFQTARDLKRAIRWSTAGAQPAPAPGSSRRWLVWAVAAAIFAVLAAAGWMRSPSNSRSAPRELALSIAPPSESGIQATWSIGLAIPEISPDGTAVIYRDYGPGNRSLAAGYQLRRLDSFSLEELQIPTRDRGSWMTWSPDSQSLTYDSGGALWRMRVPDGVPERITSAVGPIAGGSWSESGKLLFASLTTETELFLVPMAGDEAHAVMLPGLPEGSYFHPQFISGTDDFLVGFEPQEAEEVEIYLATLRDGEPEDPVLLMRNKTVPRFTPAGGGRLLFVRDNVLYAQGLDPAARRLEGDPEIVVREVSSDSSYHLAHFSVSRDGVLAWRPGREAGNRLITFDRSGKQIAVSGAPSPIILSVKLAPDEQHLLTATARQQYLVEPGQPGQLSVKGDRASLTTIWADSTRLLVPQPGRILERPVSGGQARLIAQVPGLDRLEDVSPDGNVVLYTSGALASEVFATYLDRSAPDRPVLQTGEQIYDTRFSPDGRWIVFEAYPTAGQADGGIYVQPFPEGQRHQISSSGKYPVWRKDGREIIFLDEDQVQSIRVDQAGGDLRFSPPEPLFPVRPTAGVVDITPLAITRDGSRIYLTQPVEQPDSDVIRIRIGWTPQR